MRISDWSSDVCSSDLVPRPVDGPPGELLVGRLLQQRPAGFDRPSEPGGGDPERALLSESGSIDVERHGPRLRSRSDMAPAHTDEPRGREEPGARHRRRIRVLCTKVYTWLPHGKHRKRGVE